MEKDKQQTRELKQTEARSYEVLLGEAHLSEQRPPFSKLRDCYAVRRPEEVSEMVWHFEELDADLPFNWCACIARQALCP